MVELGKHKDKVKLTSKEAKEFKIYKRRMFEELLKKNSFKKMTQDNQLKELNVLMQENINYPPFVRDLPLLENVVMKYHAKSLPLETSKTFISNSFKDYGYIKKNNTYVKIEAKVSEENLQKLTLAIKKYHLGSTHESIITVVVQCRQYQGKILAETFQRHFKTEILGYNVLDRCVLFYVPDRETAKIITSLINQIKSELIETKSSKDL